jgi:hypothetical protein
MVYAWQFIDAPMAFEVANLGAREKLANETTEDHCVLRFLDISL